MDESLEQWLSFLDNDEFHLSNEHDMTSLMKETKGEISTQSEELSLEEDTGFDIVKQHASSETLPFSFEDSIAVPNTSKSAPKKGRSLSHTQNRNLAERKRRENLTCMFIELSTMIPGLKKMDKLTILSKTINYVKYREERVNDLEEQNKMREIESAGCFKMNNVDVTCHGLDRPIKMCPKVETRVLVKDVLIKVLSEKQKATVPKLLAKLEAHNLSIVCSNVLPFGNSALSVTSIAQEMDEYNLFDHMNSFEEVFKGEINSVQPKLFSKSHPCDSNLTKENTSFLSNHINSSFNKTILKHHASQDETLSSSTSSSLSYTLSFEDSTAVSYIFH